MAKKVFPENPALSHTTSYRFLASCQNLEKPNDTIPRKRPGRRKGGRTDGRTGRPYFIGPFRLTPEDQLWRKAKRLLSDKVKSSEKIT